MLLCLMKVFNYDKVPTQDYKNLIFHLQLCYILFYISPLTNELNQVTTLLLRKKFRNILLLSYTHEAGITSTIENKNTYLDQSQIQ